MIVMEKHQDRKIQMNDQLDLRDTQETLPMLGYGLINISDLSNNNKIHILFMSHLII